MTAGDHVAVRRRKGYLHHGVEITDSRVVYLGRQPGSATPATVRVGRMTDFLGGGTMRLIEHRVRLDPEVTVELAESQLGQSGINLGTNDSEHFATWCVTGIATNCRRVGTAPPGHGGEALVEGVVAGVGLATGVGSFAGLSGSGIMSGLAVAGAGVGGGAAAGLGVLGVAPGLAGVAVMQAVLRDDPTATLDERTARSVGRHAARIGSVGGGVAGVGAVGALGSVGGLSAAGITSGLAAIGGAVGGGMVVGTAMVMAAPAVAAASLGYGAYRAVRFWRRK